MPTKNRGISAEAQHVVNALEATQISCLKAANSPGNAGLLSVVQAQFAQVQAMLAKWGDIEFARDAEGTAEAAGMAAPGVPSTGNVALPGGQIPSANRAI